MTTREHWDQVKALTRACIGGGLSASELSVLLAKIEDPQKDLPLGVGACTEVRDK